MRRSSVRETWWPGSTPSATRPSAALPESSEASRRARWASRRPSANSCSDRGECSRAPRGSSPHSARGGKPAAEERDGVARDAPSAPEKPDRRSRGGPREGGRRGIAGLFRRDRGAVRGAGRAPRGIRPREVPAGPGLIPVRGARPLGRSTWLEGGEAWSGRSTRTGSALGSALRARRPAEEERQEPPLSGRDRSDPAPGTAPRGRSSPPRPTRIPCAGSHPGWTSSAPPATTSRCRTFPGAAIRVPAWPGSRGVKRGAAPRRIGRPRPRAPRRPGPPRPTRGSRSARVRRGEPGSSATTRPRRESGP